MNLKPLISAVGNFCKRHSTKILAGGAIVAQGVGYYFMHKEAPIVHERLKALPEGATPMDKIKVAAPVYLPALGMLLLSSGCIVGGVISGERKVAVVSGLYTASQAALTKFEDEMKADVGEEKTQQAKAEAVRAFLTDNSDGEKTQTVPVNTGEGSDLFQDPFTGTWFYSSRASIENGVATFNRNLMSEIWANVNDLLDCWHLPECKLGGYVGWNADDIRNDTGRYGLDIGYEPVMSPFGKSAQRIKVYNDVHVYNNREDYYCRF